MPIKKEKFKGQKEVCRLLRKWSAAVDNSKKKKQAERIFNKICEIKRGNIRPF